MNWILQLLQKPYPFHARFSKSIRPILVFSTIVPLFLIVFQPFGIGASNCEWQMAMLAGTFIPIFLGLSVNFYGLVRLFSQFFDGDNWNVGKETVWSIWNFITIMFMVSIYWSLVPVCGPSSIVWTEQILNALLIGLIPITSCIYFNYSYMLKRKLVKAEELNAVLQERISYHEHGQLNLEGANNSERVSLSTDRLILIQSQDNYSKIVLEKGGVVESKLIRSSLRDIENQIDYSFIVKCHRSYIVNLSRVEKVSGNARDFKVKLSNYPDWIPVSRDAYKKIAALFMEYPPKTDAAISFSFK